jgi:hypothetical protein
LVWVEGERQHTTNAKAAPADSAPAASPPHRTCVRRKVWGGRVSSAQVKVIWASASRCAWMLRGACNQKPPETMEPIRRCVRVLGGACVCVRACERSCVREREASKRLKM